ncbi:MAG TPA: Arc family DNA-binding protein [Gammaproteobacteria bacterium]
MADLIIRNLDEHIVQALKRRAAKHGRSVEAEHRAILETALLKPHRRTLAQSLAAMPYVGKDEDFERK